MTAADVTALYLHIPFCERKCEYCDFVSVAGAKGQHEYIAALRAEVRALGAGARRRARCAPSSSAAARPGLLDLAPDGRADGRGARRVRRRPGRGGDARGQPLELVAAAGARRGGPPASTGSASACRAPTPTSSASSAASTTPTVPSPPSARCARRASTTSAPTSSTRCRGSTTAAGRETLARVIDAGARPRLVLRADRRGRHAAAPLGRRRARVRVVDPDTALRQHRIAVDTLGRCRLRAVRGEQLRPRRPRSARTTSCTGATATTPPPGSARTGTFPPRWPRPSASSRRRRCAVLPLRARPRRGRVRGRPRRRAAVGAQRRVDRRRACATRSRSCSGCACARACGSSTTGRSARRASSPPPASSSSTGARATVTPRGEDVLNQVALRLAHPG